MAFGHEVPLRGTRNRLNCLNPAKRCLVASAPCSRDIYGMVLYENNPMSQPPDKREPPQPEQHSGIWPPPPKMPHPQRVVTPVYAATYLTGINWLDAILGIPAGFLSGFTLYAVTALLADFISKPPTHRPKMLAICLVGLILISTFSYLTQRKYSLFAFTMWLGIVPFYLLMIILACFATAP